MSPRKGTREAWLALHLLQHKLGKYFGLQRLRGQKELQSYLHSLPASLNIWKWCTYLLYNAFYASPRANKSCHPQQICNSVCAIVMIYVSSGCIMERFCYQLDWFIALSTHIIGFFCPSALSAGGTCWAFFVSFNQPSLFWPDNACSPKLEWSWCKVFLRGKEAQLSGETTSEQSLIEPWEAFLYLIQLFLKLQIYEYKGKKLCKCDTECTKKPDFSFNQGLFCPSNSKRGESQRSEQTQCLGCSLSSQRRLLPSLLWLVLIEPWEAFLYLTQLFLKLQIHEYKRKKLCKCDTWVHTKQISHSIKGYFVPATASLVKFSSQSRRVLAVVSALSVICNCPAILGQKNFILFERL